MALPGGGPRHPVRAKVRCGIKRGKLPASVDWFLSDDRELSLLFGDKPGRLRVWLPYAEPEANFSSGLEWWRGKQLACYSKDGGSDPAAYRLGSLVDKDDTVRSARTFGQGRKAISCRFRECPHFGKNAGNKECRPMGRLVFWLDGGTRDKGVFQLDTKGWDTITQAEAFLEQAALRGDLRGRPFELAVRIDKKGNKHFPIITLSEVENGSKQSSVRGGQQAGPVDPEAAQQGPSPQAPSPVGVRSGASPGWPAPGSADAVRGSGQGVGSHAGERRSSGDTGLHGRGTGVGDVQPEGVRGAAASTDVGPAALGSAPDDGNAGAAQPEQEREPGSPSEQPAGGRRTATGQARPGHGQQRVAAGQDQPDEEGGEPLRLEGRLAQLLVQLGQDPTDPKILKWVAAVGEVAAEAACEERFLGA